jgi:hypothetical protein
MQSYSLSLACVSATRHSHIYLESVRVPSQVPSDRPPSVSPAIPAANSTIQVSILQSPYVRTAPAHAHSVPAARS